MNFVVTRYLKQAEGVDYKRLPLGYFFVIFFLRAKVVPKKLLSYTVELDSLVY